ncbi:MAG: transglutaminase family protein [Acidobacteria bacterium]|nr:transglutaminase family protein [Acidobacteriota bacterium]
MSAAYHVQHDTHYDYASVVAASQHLAYLRPRELPFQHVRSSRLVIEPEPSRLLQRTDYFGNAADQFELLRPHAALHVSATSEVEVSAAHDGLDPRASAPWEAVRAACRQPGDAATLDAAQFVYASPYVVLDADIQAFAVRSFQPGRAILDAVLDLTHRIHEEFTFDPSATSITTPVARVLAERRGVCQDFAHFEVSCLRSMGLPARYVSGYLLTDPPPGQPRLIGADASHAWVSVFCRHVGWVDVDPTNDLLVGERHITLAWGRDFGDVSPLRGVLLGGEEHRLRVEVSVMPVEVPDAVAPPRPMLER